MGERAEPLKALGIGQVVGLGNLLERLAEEQPLDRQLQLLARERARDGRDREQFVRHVAGRERLLDAAIRIDFTDRSRPDPRASA